MASGFRGAVFDVDGVLVDSPHERAWRDALQQLTESDWSDVQPETSYSPDRFTPQVYQEVMSGKPRFKTIPPAKTRPLAPRRLLPTPRAYATSPSARAL